LVENYLRLTDEEEERFVKEARQRENSEELLNLPISYEEKGKKIGREEGLQEGLKEGRKSGRQEVRREVALNMIRDGFEVEKIIKLTQLTRGEIEQLKDE